MHGFRISVQIPDSIAWPREFRNGFLNIVLGNVLGNDNIVLENIDRVILSFQGNKWIETMLLACCVIKVSTGFALEFLSDTIHLHKLSQIINLVQILGKEWSIS